MTPGPAIVTGAGGFIGRRLVGALRDADREVWGWTRAEIDMTDAGATAEAVARFGPAVIFNLASSGVDPRFQRDCLERDLAMTANIVAAAPPGTILVQAGSMAEYGRPGRLREDEACDPHTDYGRAKLACTNLALEGVRRGLIVRVARIFGAYGPGERAGRLLPMLVSKLSQRQPVALSSATQLRDFVQVDDVCQAMLQLAELPEGTPATVVNVGTGRAVPVAAVCERVAAMLGAAPELLCYGAIPGRDTDESMLEADTERLLALTGAVPRQHFLDASDAELARLLHIPASPEN